MGIDDPCHAAAVDTPSAGVEKERLVRRGIGAPIKIVLQRLQRAAANRDNALFPPFPGYPYHPRRQIKLTDIQPGQFRNTQTA